VLYGLFSSHPAVFHDVTVGNNSVPCSSAPDGSCVKNTAGYYFENVYNTTTGYDLATGLGSVNVTNLVNYWSSTTSLGVASKVTVAANPATAITINQSVILYGTVAADSSTVTTTPTGTVTLSGGGYTASQSLTSGAYSFTVPANSLTAGADTMTVSYGGDTTFAPSTGSTSVTVNVLTPTVTVSASSGNIANALSVGVTVTGPSGSTATPSGTVSLTGGGYSSAAVTLSGGTATIIIPANSLTAGADTLTVTYSGDSNFASNTGSTTVTMTQTVLLTPTALVSPSNSTIRSTIRKG